MPPKRSPKKSNGHKSRSTPSKSPQAHNRNRMEYIVNARDVMSIKFVRKASDLDNMDGFFSPVYVHQIFNNEKIIGYKDLQIRVFFSQPALHCYIEIDYEEQKDFDDTTDIIHAFTKWIKAGFTQNKRSFIKKLDEHFEPIGHLQAQFIRPDDDESDIQSSDSERNAKSNYSKRKRRKHSILDKKAAEKAAKSKHIRSRNSPRSSRNRKNYRSRILRQSDDKKQRETDMEDSDDQSVQSEECSPRLQRLRRRKRTMAESNNKLPPRKRRKTSNKESWHSDNSDDDNSEDSDDQKKDCINNEYEHDNPQNIENKKNIITHSKFNEEDEVIYEIRIGSFSDALTRDFHLRLQFFVLLYIESSSFLDLSDEIWEVMVLYKRYRGKYQTLGYVTLYKFFAFPDKKRLRISQVIIFPPFQRRGLGFEALNHVYKMAEYREFIEVNVEDPGEGFQRLRDTTDVYNAHIYGIFDEDDFEIINLTTYHKATINGAKDTKKIKEEIQRKLASNDIELSYSPHTKKNKRKCNGYNHMALIKKKPLFPFISQHKKLSKDVYHSAIMRAHKMLKITPEQSRIAYECLKYEYTERGTEDEYTLFKLDVKRRLYKKLHQENMHNYDKGAIFARLTHDFNGAVDRYAKILKKRDEWIQSLRDWNETHEYPSWIERKLKQSKLRRNTNNHKKNGTSNKRKRR